MWWCCGMGCCSRSGRPEGAGLAAGGAERPSESWRQSHESSLQRAPLSTPVVLQVVGGAAIVSALLPLIFTRGRHLSWIVFLEVGVLAA